MTEQEIKDILICHLLSSSTGIEALIATSAEINLKIADDCIAQSHQISKEARDIQKMAIETKPNLGLMDITNVESGGLPIPGGSPESFLEIYDKMIKAVGFLIDNYNKMDWGNLILKLTKIVVQDFQMTLIKRRRAYKELMTSGNQFAVDPADFNIMKVTFDMICRAIMGHEFYEKFKKEVNQVNLILQKLQFQLASFTTEIKPGTEN